METVSPIARNAHPMALFPNRNSTLTGLKHTYTWYSNRKEYIATAFVCSAEKQHRGNRCLLISHSHGKDKYTARGVSDWRKSCWLRGHQVTVWKAAPEEGVSAFVPSQSDWMELRALGIDWQASDANKWRRRPWHPTQH